MAVSTSLSVDKTFKASIIVDGRKLPCYTAKTSRRSASCFVASQPNKVFAVEFDRGDFDQHKLQIVLYIDGNKVDSRLQCPQNEDEDTRMRFEYIETNSSTKGFRFSAITADMVDARSEVDSRKALPAGFGSIELAIHRAANVRKISEAKAAKQKDPEDHLALPLLPRVALNSAYHRVVFVDKDNSAEDDSDSDCESTDSCGSHYCDFDQKELVATLTFNYRSLAVLQSVGIIDPQKSSNTPGAAVTSTTAPGPSSRPRRTGTSSSSTRKISTTGPSSSVPPPRATPAGSTTAGTSRTKQPASPLAGMSSGNLPERNTQPAPPTSLTLASGAESKHIPRPPSVHRAAAAPSATQNQNPSTTRSHAGSSSNLSGTAPVFEERSSKSSQRTTQPLPTRRSLIPSAPPAKQAEKPSHNLGITAIMPDSLSSSHLAAVSYTPKPTANPADCGRPGPSQAGASSSGNEAGTSASGIHDRADRSPGQSGKMSPRPSLPAQTRVFQSSAGMFGQTAPTTSISESAPQKPVTPPARPTEGQVHIKQEPDVEVKVKPREVKRLTRTQDNEDGSADEDKQDKWDLERLQELHKRKRKRKQDRKAKSGQTFSDDEEDDDVDDQIGSLIKKLSQSNKKRRMRKRTGEVLDLSWM